MTQVGAPYLSVVSTMYRSADTIDEFVRRSAKAARSVAAQDFEIILVDDGSPDDSLERARGLIQEFPEIVVVELSRNFGHHLALLSGLDNARGQVVFLIDSDLEEEPEWLGSFLAQLRDDDVDVVFGVQEARKGGLFERWSGSLYWSLFRAVGGLDIPANAVTCRLMTRSYVDALLRHKEGQVSIGGLFAITGYRQKAVTIVKGSKGSSTYSLRLKMWHAINSITSFSTKPLEAIFLAGLTTTAIGLCILVYIIVAALFWSTPPVGWTSVMASLWIVGGMTMLSLGVVAIYAGKIFLEVKQRPRTVVRSVFRAGGDDGA